MNNPGIKDNVWTAMNQKWGRLTAEGHKVKVEFNILLNAEETEALAIDVVQNIDGAWVVQTVQRKVREAYPLIGIDDAKLDQLLGMLRHTVNSVIDPVSGHKTYDDEEMHIYMKRISPETSELYGHVITKNVEKIAVRTNYRHYYLMNAILEETAKILKEEYSEIQLHRDKDDYGKLYYRFVPVR